MTFSDIEDLYENVNNAFSFSKANVKEKPPREDDFDNSLLPSSYSNRRGYSNSYNSFNNNNNNYYSFNSSSTANKGLTNKLSTVKSITKNINIDSINSKIDHINDKVNNNLDHLNQKINDKISSKFESSKKFIRNLDIDIPNSIKKKANKFSSSDGHRHNYRDYEDEMNNGYRNFGGTNQFNADFDNAFSVLNNNNNNNNINNINKNLNSQKNNVTYNFAEKFSDDFDSTFNPQKTTINDSNLDIFVPRVNNNKSNNNDF
jgi:ABC-type antimicrobial peptide transport system permease subunit